MSKKDYKTTRNKTPKEFTLVEPRLVGLQQLNAKTIKKLFSKDVLQVKMNDWEKKFIDSLINSRYNWTQKQLVVLRKIEKKYENN